MEIKAKFGEFFNDIKLQAFTLSPARKINEGNENKKDEKVKTRLLAAWNNIRYDLGVEASLKKDIPIWILGVCHHARSIYGTPSETEEDDVFHSPLDRLVYTDFASRPHFTYRKNFPPIPGTNITTDTGWGCMLRSAQMMVAQGLMLHFLGRSWRWTAKHKRGDKNLHKEIIGWFIDDPSCPLSVHQLSEIGRKFGNIPGNWYGPNTVAYIMQEAVKQAQEKFSKLRQVSIYVAMDCTVYSEDIYDLCEWRKVNEDTVQDPDPRGDADSTSTSSASSDAEVGAEALETSNFFPASSDSEKSGIAKRHKLNFGSSEKSSEGCVIKVSEMDFSSSGGNIVLNNNHFGPTNVEISAHSEIPHCSHEASDDDGKQSKLRSESWIAVPELIPNDEEYTFRKTAGKTKKIDKIKSKLPFKKKTKKEVVDTHSDVRENNFVGCNGRDVTSNFAIDRSEDVAMSTFKLESFHNHIKSHCDTSQSSTDKNAAVMNEYSSLPFNAIQTPSPHKSPMHSRNTSKFEGPTDNFYPEATYLSSYIEKTSSDISDGAERLTKSNRPTGPVINSKLTNRHDEKTAYRTNFFSGKFISSPVNGNDNVDKQAMSACANEDLVKCKDHELKISTVSGRVKSPVFDLKNELKSSNPDKLSRSATLPDKPSGTNRPSFNQSPTGIQRSTSLSRVRRRSSTVGESSLGPSGIRQFSKNSPLAASKQTNFKAVLILIPVRLGESSLNPIYAPCIEAMLSLESSIGIIGGKPKHSLYFVGCQGSSLLHLDPHYCKPADTPHGFGKSLHDYHTFSLRKINVRKIDPSCCLGFYCRTPSEFEQFKKDGRKNFAPPQQPVSYPMCLIMDGRSGDHSIHDGSGIDDGLDDFTFTKHHTPLPFVNSGLEHEGLASSSTPERKDLTKLDSDPKTTQKRTKKQKNDGFGIDFSTTFNRLNPFPSFNRQRSTSPARRSKVEEECEEKSLESQFEML